jgi:hypothetical protein
MVLGWCERERWIFEVRKTCGEIGEDMGSLVRFGGTKPEEMMDWNGNLSRNWKRQ